jgi:tetratricopeptide (TPR) repeat protein
MTFTLPTPRARIALIAMSLALAVFLSYFGLRNALAWYYLGLDKRGGYERAVQLEPANARNWFLLGRSYLYDLEQPDSARAVQALRKAVSLDPYSAEALLDLANAYDGEGDTAAARAAFVSAQRVYPLSADVAWSYGNFLLRQGEQHLAFGQFRKAVELEPKRAAEAFSRAQSVQSDVNILLDKAMPATTEVYLPILHSLSSGGDLAAAQKVWKRLLALREKVPMRDMVDYVDAYFRERRPEDAWRAWSEAVSIMQNAPPPDPAGSLLWDGGFESGYAGGGFAWHFVPATKDVQIGFDRSEKHSGEQSLRILFNGHENLNFEDGCHNIAPEPGQRYLLTGWVKTQSLTSSQGVRLQIFVYTATNTEVVTTDEIHGTEPWKQLQLAWTAPAGARFGAVCVKRLMSDKPGSDIQGAAWIDDVSLVPVSMVEPNEGSAKP